jgi:hypothetical protein
MASPAASTSPSLDEKNSDLTSESAAPSLNQKHSWFRSTIFQATVVGICAFLSPVRPFLFPRSPLSSNRSLPLLTHSFLQGLWNAMNSLGAGGGQKPFLVNAAKCVVFIISLISDIPLTFPSPSSLVFGLMVLTCLLGSTIVNKIGYKWALVLGAAGYAPYAGGLVLNLNTGATWLVFVGSVTCGLSAGLVRCSSSLSISSGSTDSLNAGSFGPSKELSSWVVRFPPLFPSSSLPFTDPIPFNRP